MNPPRRRTVSRTLHPVIETLRQARYDQRMPVLLLAEITGYSSKAIHQWEAGTVNPKLKHLHDWAEALGMKIEVMK